MRTKTSINRRDSTVVKEKTLVKPGRLKRNIAVISPQTIPIDPRVPCTPHIVFRPSHINKRAGVKR